MAHSQLGTHHALSRYSSKFELATQRFLVRLLDHYADLDREVHT